MRDYSFALLGVSLLASGCGATLVNGSMPNPAKTQDKIESSQTYERGPYKENHQYELGIFDYTPASIGLRIRLTDIDKCGDPKNYRYTLVDERGAQSPVTLNDDAVVTKRPGRAGVTVTVTTQSATMPIALKAESTTLAVQMRPIGGTSCPALDFRWALQ